MDHMESQMDQTPSTLRLRFGSRTGKKENPWYYDMSGKKYLLILNQFYFGGRLSTRYGTEHDVNRLKKVFKKLGFDTFVKSDFTHQKIMDYLTHFASLDHTETSCIFLAILTHGGKGSRVYAADKSYLLQEVMDIFETKSLAKKPKVHIVQACRGGRTDRGYRVDADGNNWLNKPVQFFRFLMNVIQGDDVLVVPSHADTFIVRASVEGYVSYRVPDEGTIMVQELCTSIEEHHQDRHLEEIFTIMKGNVAAFDMSQTKKSKKQMPESTSTATKFFKF